jgi:hypothetical protein
MKTARILVIAAAAALLATASCSSDSTPDTATGAVGGPVSGPVDTHCAGRAPVVVDTATCSGSDTEAEAGAGGAPAQESDPNAGGADDCNATHDAQYGETLPNSEGDDDDCKYHASWTSTPIRLNQDVTFTLTATDLATGNPLAPLSDGDLPLTRVEVYQPCSPNRITPVGDYRSAKFAESAAGMYTAGPFRFDQSGRWVVRFHLYEECVDGDTSPHGHIAFFIEVP